MAMAMASMPRSILKSAGTNTMNMTKTMSTLADTATLASAPQDRKMEPTISDTGSDAEKKRGGKKPKKEGKRRRHVRDKQRSSALSSSATDIEIAPALSSHAPMDQAPPSSPQGAPAKAYASEEDDDDHNVYVDDFGAPDGLDNYYYYGAAPRYGADYEAAELEYGSDGIVRVAQGSGGSASSSGSSAVDVTMDFNGYENNMNGSNFSLNEFSYSCGALYTIVEDPEPESGCDDTSDDDGSGSVPKSMTEDDAYTDNEKSAFSLDLDFDFDGSKKSASAMSLDFAMLSEDEGTSTSSNNNNNFSKSAPSLANRSGRSRSRSRSRRRGSSCSGSMGRKWEPGESSQSDDEIENDIDILIPNHKQDFDASASSLASRRSRRSQSSNASSSKNNEGRSQRSNSSTPSKKQGHGEHQQLQASLKSTGEEFIFEEDTLQQDNSQDLRVDVDYTPIRSGRGALHQHEKEQNIQQQEEQQPQQQQPLCNETPSWQSPPGAGTKVAVQLTESKLANLPTWGQILKQQKRNSRFNDDTSDSDSEDSNSYDNSRSKMRRRRSSTYRRGSSYSKSSQGSGYSRSSRNKHNNNGPPSVIEFEITNDGAFQKDEDDDYDTLNLFIDENEVNAAIARIASAKKPKDHNDASFTLDLDPIRDSIKAAAEVPIVDAAGVIAPEVGSGSGSANGNGKTKPKDHDDFSVNLNHDMITSSIKLAAEVDIIINDRGESTVTEEDQISCKIREAAEKCASEFKSGITDSGRSDVAVVEGQRSKAYNDGVSQQAREAAAKDDDCKNTEFNSKDFNNSYNNDDSSSKMEPDSSSESSLKMDSMKMMDSMRTFRGRQMIKMDSMRTDDLLSNTGGGNGDINSDESSMSSYCGSNPSNFTEEKGHSSGDLLDLLSLGSSADSSNCTDLVFDSDFLFNNRDDEKNEAINLRALKTCNEDIVDDQIRSLEHIARTPPSKSNVITEHDNASTGGSSSDDQQEQKYMPEGRFSISSLTQRDMDNIDGGISSDDQIELSNRSGSSTGRFSRTSVSSSKANSRSSSKRRAKKGKQKEELHSDDQPALDTSETSLGRFSIASLTKSLEGSRMLLDQDNLGSSHSSSKRSAKKGSQDGDVHSNDHHGLDTSETSLGRFSIASLNKSLEGSRMLLDQVNLKDQNSTGEMSSDDEIELSYMPQSSLGRYSRTPQSQPKDGDENSIGEISSDDQNEPPFNKSESSTGRFSRASLSQSNQSMFGSSAASRDSQSKDESARSRFSLDGSAKYSKTSRGSRDCSSGASTSRRRNHSNKSNALVYEDTKDSDVESKDDSSEDEHGKTSDSSSSTSESTEGSSSASSSNSSSSSSSKGSTRSDTSSKGSTRSDTSSKGSTRSGSMSSSSTSYVSESTYSEYSESESYSTPINEEERSSGKKKSQDRRSSISSSLAAIDEGGSVQADIVKDNRDKHSESDDFSETQQGTTVGVDIKADKAPSKRLFGRNMIFSRRLSDLDVSMDKLHNGGGDKDIADSDGDSASDASSAADSPKESDQPPTLKRAGFNPKNILKRNNSRKKATDALADGQSGGNHDSCDEEEGEQTSKRAFGRKQLLKRQISRKKNSLDVTAEKVGSTSDDDKEANPAGDSDDEDLEVKESAPTKVAVRPKRMLKRQSSRKKKWSSATSEKEGTRVDCEEDSSDDEEIVKATSSKSANKHKLVLKQRSSRKNNLSTENSENEDVKNNDEGDSSDSGEVDEAQSKCPLQPKIKLKRQGYRKMASGDGVDTGKGIEANPTSKRVFHPKKMLKRQSSRKGKILGDKENDDHAKGSDDTDEDLAVSEVVKEGAISRKNGAFPTKTMLKKGWSSRNKDDLLSDEKPTAKKEEGLQHDTAGSDDTLAREEHTSRSEDERDSNRSPDGTLPLSSEQEKSSNNVPSSNINIPSTSRRERMEKSKDMDDVSSSSLSIIDSQRRNDTVLQEESLKSIAGTDAENSSREISMAHLPTNSTEEDKVAQDKETRKQVLFTATAEEITPSQRNEEKVPEDCDYEEEKVVSKAAPKNGFKPKSLLRKQSVRMKKVLDVTAEKVASVTADIATLPIKSSNSVPKTDPRRHSRQLSRKDSIARERALKRREQQFRGRRGNMSGSSHYYARDITRGHNVSLRTESSADFTDMMESEMYESDGESRHRHRDWAGHGSQGYHQRRSRSHPTEWDHEPQQHHRVNNFDHRDHRRYRSDGCGSVSTRGSRVSDSPSYRTRESTSSSRSPHYRGSIHPRDCYEEAHHSTDHDRYKEPVSWDDLQGAIEAGRRISIEDLSRNPPPVSQYRSDPPRKPPVPQYTRDPPRQHEINYNTYNAGNQGGDGGAGAQDDFSWDDLEDAINVGVQSSLSDLNFKVAKKQEWQLQTGKESSRDDENDSHKPWQCKACTFVNENGAFLLCGVCNQARS